MYSAYKLTDQARNALLARFPAKHSKVIAHHVTFKFPSDILPPDAETVDVIAEVFDEKVHAVMVKVNFPHGGKTLSPTGNVFHVTISVNQDNGGKPVMSNALCKDQHDVFFDNDTIMTLDVVPSLLKF